MPNLAPITIAFMQQICGIPDVIDVSPPGDRFGEQVIVVTIPTSAEHDEVTAKIPYNNSAINLHIMPLFGLGSFTGKTRETKKVYSLMYTSPYNVYGTPENLQLEELMSAVQKKEDEAWAAMDKNSRRAAIEYEMAKRRKHQAKFGECWSK